MVKIITKRFAQALYDAPHYDLAMDTIEADMAKTIKGDTRNKEFYNVCWLSAEPKILEIAKEFLEEKNTEARRRKLRKYINVESP